VSRLAALDSCLRRSTHGQHLPYLYAYPLHQHRMRKHVTLSALAALALLTGCSLSGGDDASPAAIRAAIAQGDFGRAQSLVSAAYEAGESNGQTRFLAGLTDLATNDGIGAETNLRAAHSAGIAKEKIQPLLAEALARQGKADEANALAAKAGNKAAIAIVKGINAWRKDDPWTAREAFEAAYRLTPDNHRLTLDLARARTELGLFPDALALTAKAAKAESRNIAARILAGGIAMRQRDYARAETFYQAALNISPGNGTALAGKARALYTGGKWKAADRLLAGLSPDHAMREDMQLLRGKIAARQGRFDAARTFFAASGDYLEGDDEAMFLAGQALSHQGQHWKAVRLMEAALRIRPDLAEYHAALIKAYRKAGDEAAAKARIAAIPPSLRDAKELRGI